MTDRTSPIRRVARLGALLVADRRVRPAVAALWVGVIVLMTLPDPMAPISLSRTNVDNAWQLGLVMAAHNHLHFGTDILWTWVPLGRLDVLSLFYPREWTEALVSVVLADVALVVAFAVLLLLRRASVLGWAAVTVALLAPSFILPGLAYELPLLGSVLLLLVLHVSRPPIAMLVGAGAGLALGAGMLVKHFDALLAVLGLVIAIAAAWSHAAKRRAVIASAIAAIATASFYGLHQSRA